MDRSTIQDHYHFCPRCAAPNQGRGRIPFRCDACGFASFFGPVAAVGGLIVNANRQLLLVRRARDPGKGKWGLPGGFIDREETAEEALFREVYEETRLKVLQAEYLMTHPNHYDYRGVVAPVLDLFFVCDVELTDPVAIARDELEEFEWAQPTAEHLDNMAFASNRKAIEFWMSRQAAC